MLRWGFKVFEVICFLFPPNTEMIIILLSLDMNASNIYLLSTAYSQKCFNKL